MPAFVDTNVLVYAEDRDAGPRHGVARDLVIDLWESGSGVLSVQVLQEFFVIVTRKKRRPLPAGAALRIVEEYMEWTIVETTRALVVGGMRLARDARISLWDALVVQAAAEAGCEVLYTEDLNDGQLFGSVRIVNPFRHRTA